MFLAKIRERKGSEEELKEERILQASEIFFYNYHEKKIKHCQRLGKQIPSEILLDKQPEIITKHFKPAIRCECMSTLFNGKLMHQLPRDRLPERHFPIAKGMKCYEFRYPWKDGKEYKCDLGDIKPTSCSRLCQDRINQMICSTPD
ncbi:Cerebral Cavernous Malformations 2 Protein [Manis pentadactyla]|nr:Cerebral Cavernous Malformations 2 Protein [Manis pentadactyla]